LKPVHPEPREAEQRAVSSVKTEVLTNGTNC